MKKQLYLTLALVTGLFSSQANALIRITWGSLEGQVFASPSAFVSKYTGVCHLQNGLYYKPESIRYTTTTITLQGPSYSNSNCSRVYSSYVNFNLSYSGYTCPEGTEFVEATNSCEAPPQVLCEDRKAQNAPGVGTVPDDGKAITATRYYCDASTMCEAIQTYTATNGNLLKNNYYTGNDCVGSEEDYDDSPWYGEKPKDPLPNGCTPHPYLEDGGYFCNKDNDGDGKPDLDADIDNDAVCDYDSEGHFSCSGGSYDKPFEVTDPTNPIDDTPDFEGGSGSNPNPIDSATSPNVDDSPAPEGSDQGVIAAVRNLNSNLTQAITTQTNKNVEGFNTVNQQLAELKQTNTQLGQTIVEQMRQDKQIYDNTKALIQNSTNGIVSNINSSANRVKDAVKHAEDGIVKATKDGAESVKGAVEAGTEQLDGSINALGDKLDGLADAVSGAIQHL